MGDRDHGRLWGGPVDESQAKALASKYLINPVSMSESQTVAYSRGTISIYHSKTFCFVQFFMILFL